MRARPNRYSGQLAEDICARVRDGASLNSILRQRGMPAPSAVSRWLALHPAFARMYDEACQERARRAQRAGARDAGLGGIASEYCETIAERLCALRAAGASMRQIARRADMPGYGTIYKWLREQSDFRLMYQAAAEEWAEAMGEEQLTIADEALSEVGAPVTARDALASAKLRIDTRERQINRMALKTYGGDGKDEGHPSFEEMLKELE